MAAPGRNGRCPMKMEPADMFSVAPTAPAVSGRLPLRLLALDIAERLFIVAVYGQFAVTLLSGLFTGPFNVIALLLVISEALPILFVLLRAPSASLSQRPVDWLLAFAGTVVPLLVTPGVATGALVPIAVPVGLMACGLLVEVSAKIVLGRGFGIVAANRGVKQAGPYRFVRHPMYAGYILTHVAFLLSAPSPRNAMLYFAALVLQVARIVREERVLNQDADYRAFAARVRYRLVPGVF
jgi:protein-S-isoprenylcysteine O-methyltransferase Ste14